MEINIVERSVKSFDNVHFLHGKLYIPEGEIKGIFHVVHGMTEHIGRYDRFMQSIANEGWLCIGYDHLGHGKTVADKSEYGFIAHKDGWDILANDVKTFSNDVRNEYGFKLPYVLMGHSMGSFIVRVAAEKYVDPDKLIIMGTGGPNPIAKAGLLITDIIKKVKGEKYISDFVDKIAFGSYNNHFADENDSRSWLTNDKKIRKIYSDDPMCTFRFTVSAMHDLIKLNSYCNRNKWFDTMSKKNIPILLVSGSDDPVGDYGKGVLKVSEKLKSAGADVKCILYPGCRHEILNDNLREQTISDIKSFSE